MSDAMTPTITQADREAAASLVALAELRPMLLSGRHDDHPYIRIVAAHREAGELASARIERAAVVAWLRAVDWCDESRAYVDCFADALERGEHITDPAVVIARNGAKPAH